MSVPQRSRLADELSRRLAAAIRGAQLYAPGHPLVTRSARALIDTLTLVHQSTPSVAIGIVGEELVVGEVPVPRAAETMSELMRRLQQLGIERIVIDKGVEEAEIEQLVAVVARGEGRRFDRGAREAAAYPRRPARAGRADLDLERRHRDVPAALRRCGEGGGESLGQRQHRRRARCGCRPRNGRFARAGGRAEPNGAAVAHRAEELRQLHVHAHGERVDSHDGAGARRRHRRRAASRVRHGCVDARHRQGADTERNPEQAGHAHTRGVHDPETPHRRRRRDPSEDAGDAGARPDRRLRAPPARRRHRIPGGLAAAAESRDIAGRHRGRVRRHAIAARLSQGVPHRSHPGGAAATTTASSSIRTWCAASSSWSASIPRGISCDSTPARSRSCSRHTHPIPIGRECASSSLRTASRIRSRVELDLWDSEEAQPRSIQAPVDPADYGIDPLTQL